jgi:hypothetical protein
MDEELKPTRDEVQRWLIETLRHSFRVEYYLSQLGIFNHDPERPHDVNGLHNKFEWEIIKGIALQYREGIDCEAFIKPAVELHRTQYHHRMWNNPDPENIAYPNPQASEEDMLTGAVDAICSLMENRPHQPKVESYYDAVHYIRKRHIHQALWAFDVADEMENIKKPDLEAITSFHEFPNPGVNQKIYEKIRSCVKDAIDSLKQQGYTFN